MSALNSRAPPSPVASGLSCCISMAPDDFVAVDWIRIRTKAVPMYAEGAGPNKVCGQGL